MNVPGTSPPDPGAPRLCDADLRVLDFIAEHGFDASKVHLLPEDDRPRAMALIRQMGVLDAYPEDESDDTLVDATLARIDRFETTLAESRRIGTGRHGTFRLADFVGIAAVLFLALGVIVPLASGVRQQSLSTQCGNHLRAVHGALGAYAESHAGDLPMAASIGDFAGLFSPRPQPRTVRPEPQPMLPTMRDPTGPQVVTSVTFFGPEGRVTIRMGAPTWAEANHSANLAPLLAGGYCAANALRCPACAEGRPCFAYRVPAEGARFRLMTQRPTVVLADANPLADRLRRGQHPAHRMANSRNHDEQGQNLLFSHGVVEWKTSPVLMDAGGTGDLDNIWIPHEDFGPAPLRMRARPRAEADNFVTQ